MLPSIGNGAKSGADCWQNKNCQIYPDRPILICGNAPDNAEQQQHQADVDTRDSDDPGHNGQHDTEGGSESSNFLHFLSPFFSVKSAGNLDKVMLHNQFANAAR